MNKNPGEWLYNIVRNNFQGKPPWDRLCLEDQLSWEAIAKKVVVSEEEKEKLRNEGREEIKDDIISYLKEITCY